MNTVVLIVDDDVGTCLVARKMVTTMGMECDIAKNAAECIEAVIKKRYDIIILDCLLPDKSGWDVSRQIHDECATKRTAIVGLLSRKNDDWLKKCGSSGMNGVLIKPILRETLARCISRFSRTLNQSSVACAGTLSPTKETGGTLSPTEDTEDACDPEGETTPELKGMLQKHGSVTSHQSYSSMRTEKRRYSNEECVDQ